MFFGISNRSDLDVAIVLERFNQKVVHAATHLQNLPYELSLARGTPTISIPGPAKLLIDLSVMKRHEVGYTYNYQVPTVC